MLIEKNYLESSRKKIIRLLLLSILLFSFTSLFSQNKDTIKINAIVIKSNYFRKNINNVDTSIIKLNKSNSISELLQNYSAYSIKESGVNGISTISFRGTSPAHTQLFWNNIPLNSPMLGQVDLTSIPVFITDKITIQSGIETLQNTCGALGGAIFLETTSDKKNEFSFNYKHSSLKNNFLALNLSLTQKHFFLKTGLFYSYGKNKFSYLNTALPNSPIDTIFNSDFKNISFLQQIKYTFQSNSYLKIFLWWNSFDKNLPSLMSYEGLYRTENQTGNNINSGIEFVKKGKLLSFQNNVAIVNNTSTYYLADSLLSLPQNIIFVKNDNLTTEISFYDYLKISMKFKKVKINILDRFQYNIVSTFDSAQYAMKGFDSDYFMNNTNFVTKFDIGKEYQTSLIISTSIDSRKLYLPAFSYSLYNKKDFFWKFNIGRNLHLPSINDLYWQPGGNPNLKPEISYTSDFTTGYNYSKHKINVILKSTLFISKISNWILWKPTEYYYWTPVNIKTVLSKGIEMNAEININKKIQHKILINYSYTSSKNLESEIMNDNSVGKQLIYIPKNNANITYFANYKHFSFSGNIKFTDKRFTSTNNYNSFILPAYFYANTSLSIRKSISKNIESTLSININNLFNTNYQSVLYRAMPRRNYAITLSLRVL